MKKKLLAIILVVAVISSVTALVYASKNQKPDVLLGQPEVTGVVLEQSLGLAYLASTPVEGEQNLEELNLEEMPDEGPPAWAPEHAREHWAWSQLGEEGPPPWAKGQSEEKTAWKESGEEGPPPWANGKGQSEEKIAWKESGEEGPPPWAKGKR